MARESVDEREKIREYPNTEIEAAVVEAMVEEEDPGEEGNGAEKSRRIATKAGREGDRERERDEDEEEEKSEQRVLRTRVIETQITLRNSLP